MGLEFAEFSVRGMKSSRDESLISRHFRKYSGVIEVQALATLDKLEITYDPEALGLEEAIYKLEESYHYRVTPMD